MKDIDRQIVLRKIDALYASERHDQIIELIENADSEHLDSELTLLLARALLDSSVDSNDGMADAAEAVLMMVRGGMSDPLWHFQLARSFFFRGRIVEAARELSKARSLAASNDRYVTIAAEVDELYDLCMQELPNYRFRYNDNEKAEFLLDVAGDFGNITELNKFEDEFGINIDIGIIKADEFKDYDTYFTIGLGAYDMFGSISSVDPDRPTGVELLVYIPNDWDDDKKAWMRSYMRMIAALPIERKTTLSIGHMFSNGAPIAPWTRFTASVLIHPQDVDMKSDLYRLYGGRRIALLQLFPLYREEMEYKLSYGLNSLIKIMSDISAVIDLNRKNVCIREDAGTTLLGRELDLAGKYGSKFCAVSRKILDEGERVGYMRRHLNLTGNMISEEDSGWLFMAGTESKEFLANPYNIKKCRINTVCNIDSDILPFLNKPYNTTVYRKPDGILTVVNDKNGEDRTLPPS